MPTINLKVSEELNKARQDLKVSWRDLIEAGLGSLQQQKAPVDPLANLKANLRSQLVAASKALKAADDLLKGASQS